MQHYVTQQFVSNYRGTRADLFFFFFITSQVKFKPSHTVCTQLELTGQLCISPHNSKARDNKLIAGLKFRPRSLRLASDLNTAAVR